MDQVQMGKIAEELNVEKAELKKKIAELRGEIADLDKKATQ